MDNETLRKVQLAQLEIGKEIKRVCDENGIKYFLDSGTLLWRIAPKSAFGSNSPQRIYSVG